MTFNSNLIRHSRAALAALALSLAAGDPASARDLIFGLSPNQSQNDLKAQVERALVFSANTLETGETALFFDAATNRLLGEFIVPKGKASDNVRARLKANGALIGALKPFITKAAPIPGRIGQIDMPGFQRLLREAYGKDDAAIIVIGSPIAHDPRAPNVSMIGASVPNDGHIAASGGVSPYGTAGLPGTLDGMDLFFGLIGEDWQVSTAHAHAVQRLWTLSTEALGAHMAFFGEDLNTLFRLAAGDVPDRKHSEPLVPTDKLEMLHFAPDNGALPDIYAARPVVEPAPAPLWQAAAPVNIGITWTVTGADIDLYVRPNPAAEVVFYNNATTDHGRLFKDYRNSPNSGFETVSLTGATDLSKLTIALNYYGGETSRSGVTGELRIAIGDQVWAAPFHIPATRGNKGDGAEAALVDGNVPNDAWLLIDPKNPDESIKINPLSDIATDIEADRPAALSRARGIALQLSPDPKDGGGANAIFYQGGRNLIVTVMLAVCVVMPPEHRNLAMVYRALSDMDILHDLLEAAAKSKALNGEIGDMARSAHAQAFGDDGNAKTFESFRINAALALEAFGPGNYLAAITSESTFRFRDLKERKVSLYIKIDYANAEVLGKFSGLMQHLAAEALVAAGNNTPVLFCLDEFVASPCQKICSILVLLRSAGVRVVMACQDLNDIERVYSKHDLETVLSETHIKQFLAVRSKKTLDWLSGYLGDYTETISSYSMGRDGPQESLARASRKLLTSDELQRLPDRAQIILFGNAKPILALKSQVFAIAPWRKTLGINSNYGSERKLSPIEVRLRWWGTEVTPRARRAYARMMRDVFRDRGQKGRLWTHLFGSLRPGLFLAIGLILVALTQSPALPNLRWDYTYTGSAQQTPRRYTTCRYVGPTSPGITHGPNCPLILWR